MIEIEDQEDVEAKAQVMPLETRKNLKPKTVIKATSNGVPGTVAHYHKKEDERFEWDEPCHYVQTIISIPEGIKLNEVLYSGRITVPQCTADYLAWLENERIRYEQGIFRSRKINKKIATLG